MVSALTADRQPCRCTCCGFARTPRQGHESAERSLRNRVADASKAAKEVALSNRTDVEAEIKEQDAKCAQRREKGKEERRQAREQKKLPRRSGPGGHAWELKGRSAKSG